MRNSLLTLFVACGIYGCSPESSLRQGHFRTVDGRTCNIACEGDGCYLDACSFPPSPIAGCQEGYDPAYTLVSALANGPYNTMLCDGCGNGNLTKFQEEDCVDVVCVEAIDCPYRADRCESDVCTHESPISISADASIDH